MICVGTIFIKKGEIENDSETSNNLLKVPQSKRPEESGLESRSSDFKAHQLVWSLCINNLTIGLFPTDFGFLIISYFRGLREKAFKVFNLLFYYFFWCSSDITHLALLQEIIGNRTCYSTPSSLGICGTPIDC